MFWDSYSTEHSWTAISVKLSKLTMSTPEKHHSNTGKFQYIQHISPVFSWLWICFAFWFNMSEPTFDQKVNLTNCMSSRVAILKQHWSNIICNGRNSSSIEGLDDLAQHKKCFPLRISYANVTKSAVLLKISIMENFIFCAVWITTVR